MINYTEKEILEILKDEQKTDEFLATLTGEDVKKLLTYINSKVRNIPNEENDVYNGYMVVGALISPKNDIQNRCFEKIAESLKNIKGNRNRASANAAGGMKASAWESHPGRSLPRKANTGTTRQMRMVAAQAMPINANSLHDMGTPLPGNDHTRSNAGQGADKDSRTR